MKYVFYFTESKGQYAIVDADNESEAREKAELAAYNIRYDQTEIFYAAEYCCRADSFHENEYLTIDELTEEY